MLVLSRKVGEEIVIGEDIRVTIVEVRGNRIKLGFAGPREVTVRRGELVRQPSNRERVVESLAAS